MMNTRLPRQILDKLFLRMGYMRNPKYLIKSNKPGNLTLDVVDAIGKIFYGISNEIVQGVLCSLLGRSIYFSVSSEKHMQHLIDVAFYNICNGINQTSEFEGDDLRVENPLPMNDVSEFKETLH